MARELYAQRCVQAKARAEKEVIWQLGDEVTGPLPKQLVGGNYFAEQRQFNLSLQANGINFDQFLKVRGQTVEEFRSWLHTQAERKLRSWLGLLLVAEKPLNWRSTVTTATKNVQPMQRARRRCGSRWPARSGHSAVPRLSSGHARSWYGSWAMQ